MLADATTTAIMLHAIMNINLRDADRSCVSLCFLCLALLLAPAGCTRVPRFVLWNNTASEIGVLWGDREIWVRSHTLHDLPNKPTLDVNSRPFDVVIIRGQKRFGYIFDLRGLISRKAHRSAGAKLIFYLHLDESGKILLCESRLHPEVPAREQPIGFPVEPVPLD